MLIPPFPLKVFYWTNCVSGRIVLQTAKSRLHLYLQLKGEKASRFHNIFPSHLVLTANSKKCPCRGSHIEVNQDCNRLFLTRFTILSPPKTNAAHSPASSSSGLILSLDFVTRCYCLVTLQPTLRVIDKQVILFLNMYMHLKTNVFCTWARIAQLATGLVGDKGDSIVKQPWPEYILKPTF